MKNFSRFLLEKKDKTPSKKGISDSEINKRLSASTTKGDQARSLYGTDGGYGDSNVGDETANKSLKKGKPYTKAESDAIQTRSLNKKTKKFVNKPGTTKSKGPGASTGGQKNLVVNPKSKGTTPVTVTTKTSKSVEPEVPIDLLIASALVKSADFLLFISCINLSFFTVLFGLF